MASSTDVREWLRGHPEVTGDAEVSNKGNIRKTWQEAYDAAHGGTVLAFSDPPREPEDIYDGGVTEADFPPPEDEPARPAERAPRRAAKAKPAETGRGIGRLFARDPKGKPKAKRARINLNSFAENAWCDLAEVAPWPPLQRCLSFQAAYAATVLDDIAKGTFIDPALQVVARADQAFRAVDALLGVPMFTAMICMAGGAEHDKAGVMVRDEHGWPVWDQRTQLMFMGLKYSLIQMDRMAELHMDEIEAKAVAIGERQQRVERMIALMFAEFRVPPQAAANGEGPPPAAARPAASVPGFVYPPPAPMDDTGADPKRSS
jgi:hypothetical protein